MPTPEPYDLPEPVLDAAMSRLVVDDDRQRRTALAELIAAYPEHGDGLRALLSAVDGAGRLLVRSFASPAPDEPPRIEGYRVVRTLGEGAFGVVHLCEQLAPVKRRVALKLLRPGVGDRSTLARFDAERQFLARLNHPAIAQVFDAGLLPDGRPWFAMEHVAGVPIATYCDREQLSIEARLSLFMRLCQGVQYAHEQGIVHRDLKPTNILVVEVDGLAQPKIIDFGIARALQPTTERAVGSTETGRVVGTPGYMSPEQSAGRHAEIDARCDVFSLGVVLYELLTGELPWGRRPETTDSEPPRPSQRIGSDPRRNTTIAEQRGSQPKKLASRLRGDLDWIVLRALERERSRRYASAAELAAEIQRHLRGEPVHAGPPSWTYRLRKFGRRRRTTLTAVALVALTVVAGALLVGRYRDEASARGSDAAAAVASLLARAQHLDVTSAPQSDRVRRALAEEALHIYERFLVDRPDDPALREGHARALTTLAQVHLLLGQYPEAEQAAREAVVDLEPLLDQARDRITYRSLLGIARWFVGRAQLSMGQRAAARLQLENAMDLLGRCCDENAAEHTEPFVATCRELAAMLDLPVESARCLELLARARQAQEAVIRLQPLALTHREVLLQIDVSRGMLLAAIGEHDAAMATLRTNDELISAHPDISVRTVASVHAAAAEILARGDDEQQAFARLQRAVDAARSWVDREPNLVVPRTLLAQLLSQQAAWQGAARLPMAPITTSRAAVAAAEAWWVRGSTDPKAMVQLIDGLVDLVSALSYPGRRSLLAEAEACARRAVELASVPTVALERHVQLRQRWRTLGHLGCVADHLGLADVEAVWRAAEEAMHAGLAETAIGADTARDYVLVSVRIARRHLEAGRNEQAGALLDEAMRIAEQYRDAVPDMAIEAPEAYRLAAVLAARRGRLDEAEDRAEKVHAVFDGWRGCLCAARALDEIGRCAVATGDPAQARFLERAIELYESAIEILSTPSPAASEHLGAVVSLAQARIRLALAQRDRGAVVATNELAEAIDTLSAARDEVFASEWDEVLFLAGKALLPH